ncbi:hypothetical protein [Lactiplantibacillus plantarum]|uniref:hypothetical protein n=1 Tax=Lactiplantibacillus plantarum TaxID=1590 RepID=UPI0009B58589|nr:hypothetical protein [Lactiplantibacillus plantarum]
MKIVSLDVIADKIVALGVPGILFVVAYTSSGYFGAAAITSILATFGGPLGMVGGITMLGIIGLISQAVAQFGSNMAIKAVIRKQLNSHSVDEIKKIVSGYPISKKLKLSVCDYLDQFENR